MKIFDRYHAFTRLFMHESVHTYMVNCCVLHVNMYIAAHVKRIERFIEGATPRAHQSFPTEISVRVTIVSTFTLIIHWV